VGVQALYALVCDVGEIDADRQVRTQCEMLVAVDEPRGNSIASGIDLPRLVTGDGDNVFIRAYGHELSRCYGECDGSWYIDIDSIDVGIVYDQIWPRRRGFVIRRARGRRCPDY